MPDVVFEAENYERAVEACIGENSRCPHNAQLLCPVCHNDVHLHTGSGQRDCTATMIRVIAGLHREVHGDA